MVCTNLMPFPTFFKNPFAHNIASWYELYEVKKQMNTNDTNFRSSDLSHEQMERLIRRGNQLHHKAIAAGLKSLFGYLKHGGTRLSDRAPDATNRGRAGKAATYG